MAFNQSSEKGCLWNSLSDDFCRWGLSRHFHYVPKILAAFFWTVPALFNHVSMFFRLLLLLNVWKGKASPFNWLFHHFSVSHTSTWFFLWFCCSIVRKGTMIGVHPSKLTYLVGEIPLSFFLTTVVLNYGGCVYLSVSCFRQFTLRMQNHFKNCFRQFTL